LYMPRTSGRARSWECWPKRRRTWWRQGLSLDTPPRTVPSTAPAAHTGRHPCRP
jgi:hypothetical protein